MRKHLILLMIVTLLPSLAGCYKLRARIQLKEGNSAYSNEDYKDAIEQYQRGLKLDPDATFAWRSVGLAALAIYRPGEETPENKQTGDLAIEAFEKYLVDYPEDEKVRDYLMTMYINTKRYDDALAYLDRMAAAQPGEADQVRKLKINILTQADRFEEAWQLAQQGGVDPEAFYTIGVAAWDAAYNDPELNFEARQKVVDLGIQALDRAVKAKDDYAEAMVYYGLILREKAKLTTDGTERLALDEQSLDWRNKAQELLKARAAQEAKAAAEAAKANQAADPGAAGGR